MTDRARTLINSQDRASDEYPSVEISGHRVHVFEIDDDYSVWLNTEDCDFTGLCIGSGNTRGEAVGQAVASLEAVVAFLQGPPARELTADEAAKALGTFVAGKVEGAR